MLCHSRRHPGLCAGLVLFALIGSARARAWEVQWEKSIEAAKREGQLNIYHSIGFQGIFQTFHKDHPYIKIVSVAGRGSQLAPRILAERRAGKYLADVYTGGATPNFNVFYKGKLLDAIKPSLLLPEVLDESKWYGGKHTYLDPEGKYIFSYVANSESVQLHYNTRLVNPADFNSYWDLLQPRWRGKIVSFNPRATGGIGPSLQFFYYHPEVGPEFVRRFFGGMDITLSSDFRQMTDWLGQGRFAMCMGCRDTQTAKQQGLAVESFDTSLWKEGGGITSGGGSLSVFNQAPHPAAVKLFINWLLSRKGQMALGLTDPDNPPNSRRIDIPKDHVRPQRIPIEGRKYLDVTRPEWSDLTPIFKLLDEVLMVTR